MSASMYYIAIVAPDDINEQVLKCKYYMREHFKCSIALKSPAHITLVSPFWMNENMQPALEKAIEIFSELQKNFAIQLKNFDAFKPKVLFVGVTISPQLQQLKTSLENHLGTTFPIKKESRAFHPHITIATRDLHKKDFYTAWNYFKDKNFTAAFPATGISLLKHNGIKWEVVFTAGFST